MILFLKVNCQVINFSFTEIPNLRNVVRDSRILHQPPAITSGIERVREMVVLGVTLTDTLTFRQHVDRIVTRTAQTSYALPLFRSHGLDAPLLSMFLEPRLFLSSLTHSLPGQDLLIAKMKHVSKQSFKSCKDRVPPPPHNFETFKQICDAADAQLFSSIIHNDAPMYGISCSSLLKHTTLPA